MLIIKIRETYLINICFKVECANLIRAAVNLLMNLLIQKYLTILL